MIYEFMNDSFTLLVTRIKGIIASCTRVAFQLFDESQTEKQIDFGRRS